MFSTEYKIISKRHSEFCLFLTTEGCSMPPHAVLSAQHRKVGRISCSFVINWLETERTIC